MKTNEKLNHNADEIYDYLTQWRDEENWTDFNQAMSMSCVLGLEYPAYLMVNAGGIDSENCYEEYKSIEKDIEKLSDSFQIMDEKNQQDLVDKIFALCTVFRCDDCNHVSFVCEENIEMYAEELTKCWSCGSKNIKAEKY